MSIKTEIDRIKQSKADIISALTTKGVTVPSDASIDDLSALVDAIEVASDPVLQSKTVSPTTSKQTITPDTGYDGLSQVTVNAMTTATQATPSITVSSSGLITAKSTQTAGYVSAGTKSATKQLTTKGATTWTPKTSNQTIASGTYLTGTQTIKGDSNLVSSNIKSGVSIFGVAGTLEAGGGSGGSVETVDLAFWDDGIYPSTAFSPNWECTASVFENGVVTTKTATLEGDANVEISNVVVGSALVVRETTTGKNLSGYADGNSTVLFVDDSVIVYKVASNETCINYACTS